jgi:predicted amidohydrolase
VTICHEGWRYPEGVRWAARRGAQVVFHPQMTGSDRTGPTIERWGDPDSSLATGLIANRFRAEFYPAE